MIIKKADLDTIIQGALSAVVNQVDFKNKPFESIFGLVGPAVLGKFSPALGILSYITQIFDFGPNRIGRLIDEYMKNSKKDGQADTSDNNLMNVATKVVHDITDKIGGEAKADLEQLYFIKNAITCEDLLVVAYLNKYAKPAALSAATKAGLLGRIRQTGYIKSAISALYLMLKKSFKGLLVMGVLGGLYAGITGKTTLPMHEQKPVNNQISSNIQNYTNVNNNAEDTLITFLDAAVSGFSQHFQAVNKHPLKGSLKMAQVLKQLEQDNLTNIDNLNNSKIFRGPKVIMLAKQLLPEAQYEAIKSEKPEDLHNLLKGVLK